MSDWTTAPNSPADESPSLPNDPPGTTPLPNVTFKLGSLIPYLVGAAAIIAFGMVFGAALWVLAGMAAILTLVVARFLSRDAAGALRIEREQGDIEVAVGSLVPIELQVVNSGKTPIPWVLVEDLAARETTSEVGERLADFPDNAGGTQSTQATMLAKSSIIRPPIQIEGSRLGVFFLPPGKNESLTYSIRCERRGYIQVGPTMVETGDLFGFFRKFRLASKPRFITVLPTVVPLTGYDIGSRRPIGEIRMRDNIMDDPTRLRGIRRWQPGDPMRSVHWSATARTGTLHSKVYEPSSIAGATLILDMHRTSNPDHHEPMRCDLAISATASIASALQQEGEPFALVTNARDAADRVRVEQEQWSRSDGQSSRDFRRRDVATRHHAMKQINDRRRPIVMQPDRSLIHYREMLRTLARLERTDALTLPELLTECESRLSAETTMMVILQTADESTLAALIGLARRGRAVAVIVNTHEPEDFARIAGPLTAVGIETMHLRSQTEIAELCRTAVRL